MPCAFAVEGQWDNIPPNHRYVQRVADFAARSLVGPNAWADTVFAGGGFVCKHFPF